MSTQHRKVFLVISLLITIFIFANSLMPAHISSEQSGFFTRIFFDALTKFNVHITYSQASLFIRKTAHFAQFFLLGLAWFMTFISSHSPFKAFQITLGITSLTALMDETIQLFIDGRAFSLTDIFIDILGALFAAIILLVVYSRNIKI